MVAKSILQIDVKDESFQRFAASYKEYYDKLEKMPGAWAAGGKAMAAATMAQTKVLKEQAEAEKEAREAALEDAKRLKYESEAMSRAWQGIGRHSIAFAHNIESVTKSLLKWTALTTVFTGLLGVGSLFGLERVAYAASGARRSAQGLGVSIGEQKAFGLAYGNVVDAGKLEEVQGSQYDWQQRQYYAAMNIDPEGKNVANLAIEMMARAKQIYQPGMSQQEMNAAGIGHFFNRDELNRIRGNDLGELNGQYRNEIGRIGYSDETAAGWQKFLKQLQDASGVIERIFVEDLGKLQGPLGSLSKGLVDIVAALGDSPKVKHWLEELAAALEHLATWLGGTPKDVIEGKDSGESFLEGWRKQLFEPDVKTDKKLLQAIAMTESQGNPGLTSPKGAMGLFQFMPDTWKQYGNGGNPYDASDSARAAERFVKHLTAKFNGDLDKILAAYNWGEGNVDKDVAMYSRRWKEHLPQETKNYIHDTAARYNATRIVIENNTGGNAVVNANQAATAQ